MDESLIGVIVIIIGVGLPLLLVGSFILRLFKNYKKNKKLLATGKVAKGTILSIQQTGTYINEQPEVLFNIRVEPDGEPTFDSTAKRVVSLLQIPQIQPGQIIYVKYDPNDHSSVALVEQNNVIQQDTEQIQKKLLKNEEVNVRLNNIGIEAEAIITKFTDLNIMVNGDNKSITLEVKVIPGNDKPFNSIVKGIFMPSGLYKYQPGKEIHIKYDPNDKSIVAIDYSKSEVKKIE